jgi:hypothetical protein
VPETGKDSPRFADSASLKQWLTAHYKANGYELPGDIMAKVEAFICEREVDYCIGDSTLSTSSTTPRSNLAHTFHVVVQGTRTLVSWMAKGMQFVPQEQANARAAVCANCPFNDEPQGCTNCNMDTLRKLAEGLIGTRTTPHSSQLKACRVCSCQLAAKVWLPLRTLLDHMPDEQVARLPAHCWLVTERKQAIVNAVFTELTPT